MKAENKGADIYRLRRQYFKCHEQAEYAAACVPQSRRPNLWLVATPTRGRDFVFWGAGQTIVVLIKFSVKNRRATGGALASTRK